MKARLLLLAALFAPVFGLADCSGKEEGTKEENALPRQSRGSKSPLADPWETPAPAIETVKGIPEGAPPAESGTGAGAEKDLKPAIVVEGKALEDYEWGMATWGMSSGHFTYRLVLEIGNASPSPIEFDSVVLSFDNASIRDRSLHHVSRERIAFSAKAMRCEFFYGKDEESRNDPDFVAEPITLAPKTGLCIRHIKTGSVVPAHPGMEPTEMVLVLMKGGKEVSEAQHCVLPPFTNDMPGQPTADVEQAGRPLKFVSGSVLPKPSWVVDEQKQQAAFAAAAKVSPEAKLSGIFAEVAVTWGYRGERKAQPLSWIYAFWSSQKSFNVKVFEDNSTDVKFQERSAETGANSCLDADLLKQCRVDARKAVLMLEAAGAICTGDGGMMWLVPFEVAGRTRPVWVLPYVLEDRGKLFVLADTGEVLTRDSGGWALVHGIIWNKPAR